MDILIAEDDPDTRLMLQRALQQWGYRVLATADGQSAYEALNRDDSPSLAIFDWMMPKLDGRALCRRLREDPAKNSLYIIMLTARGDREDLVDGLESGADDYITKPFNCDELRARINVGMRSVNSKKRLRERVTELEEAFRRVKQLQGMLPICSYCKSIRNDDDNWQRVEEYIVEHSDAHFSHGICLRQQGVPTEGLNLDSGVIPE
jgi:phosphoserine phosphatase RsbU/P